jgi:hypothetical protein
MGDRREGAVVVLEILKLWIITSALACALTSSAAAAGESFEEVALAEVRRGLELSFTGPSELADGVALIALLARTSSSLEQAVAGAPRVTCVTESGRFEGRLSLRGVLLPDEYRLLLVRASDLSTELASSTVRVGEASEVAPARARFSGWLARAHDALRGIAVALEEQLAFAGAVEREAAGQHRRLAELRARLRAALSESHESAYREAVMDLRLFQRRILLPPLEPAIVALFAIAEVIKERARLCHAALDAAGADSKLPLPDLSAYLALSDAVCRAIGATPAPRSWRLGVGATPEAGALEGGRYLSATGFSIAVPDTWICDPSTAPSRRRLTLRPKSGGAGLGAQVSLLEKPVGPLLRATSIEAWESWNGYQRESMKELDDGRVGVLHRFRGEAPGGDGAVTLRILELRLQRDDGRVVQLLAYAPVATFDQHEAVLATLLAELR